MEERQPDQRRRPRIRHQRVQEIVHRHFDVLQRAIVSGGSMGPCCDTHGIEDRVGERIGVIEGGRLVDGGRQGQHFLEVLVETPLEQQTVAVRDLGKDV